MADVTDAVPRRNRAQLLLLGGIVVALGLVALVLLLNTVLFAENVATRGVVPGVDRAQDHATFANESGGAILVRHERVEYTNWSSCGPPNPCNSARVNVNRTINTTGDIAEARLLQRNGAVATMGTEHLRRGAVLKQNVSRNFTDKEVDRDWDLVETEGIRNYTMLVDPTETETDVSDLTSGDAFRVSVTGNGGSGRTWEALIDSTPSDEVRVRVSEDGAFPLTSTIDSDETCISDPGNATVNFTAGTLTGDPSCSLGFAIDDTGTELSEPYLLRYKGSEHANGTYHVAVSNTSSDTVFIQNLNASTTAENPRRYHAAYSAVVNVTYRDGTTRYRTLIRVAPGEPPQTRPPQP